MGLGQTHLLPLPMLTLQVFCMLLRRRAAAASAAGVGWSTPMPVLPPVQRP